jgi:hypothetical protein
VTRGVTRGRRNARHVTDTPVFVERRLEFRSLAVLALEASPSDLHSCYGFRAGPARLGCGLVDCVRAARVMQLKTAGVCAQTLVAPCNRVLCHCCATTAIHTDTGWDDRPKSQCKHYQLGRDVII